MSNLLKAIRTHRFDSAGALADAGAQAVAEALWDAIRDNGQAAAALAGGSTPFGLYGNLANQPLDWRSVKLVPTDERCVPEDHEASNIAKLRAAFRDTKAEEATLQTLYDPAWHDAAAAHAENAVRPLMPLACAVIGMGTDAHFASLFPQSPGLSEGLDPDSGRHTVATRPEPLPPEAPFPRISLTLPALLTAPRLLLVITGQKKWEVLARAAEASAQDAPVRALLEAGADRLSILYAD